MITEPSPDHPDCWILSTSQQPFTEFRTTMIASIRFLWKLMWAIDYNIYQMSLL